MSHRKQEFHYIYDASKRGLFHRLQMAVGDLKEAAGLYKLWAHLGWRDQTSTTKRTYLGYVWHIIATVAQVVILGFIYGALFEEGPATMMLYLSVGLSLWSFISSVFFGSFNVFANYRNFLLARDIPLPLLIFRDLCGDMILMATKMMGFVVLSVVFLVPLNASAFLAVPGMMMIIIMAFPVKLICATAGTRFRDLQFAFQPFGLAAFLITPVLWREKFLDTHSWVSVYNPFTHILEIVRSPLLGETPQLTSYYAVLSMMVIFWFVGIFVYARYRNRIAVWL